MHKAMLQTGVVQYGEVLIAHPIEKVWDAMVRYHEWVPAHSMGRRVTIRGESGKVGEVVEVLKAGAADSVFVETVRIRPPQAVAGSRRTGNIVWKVYDAEVTFSRFSDFGVWEEAGQSVFCRSVYTELPATSEELDRIRRDQAQGKPDELALEDIRVRMSAFIANAGR